MSSKPRFVGEKVRVSDAFDLRMGKTPSRKNPAYWRDGGHDWVSIADLGSFGKYVGVTKERINDLAISESGIKPAPANTVLMSFKLSLGKTSITTEPVYTNEAIMAFVDKGVYPVDASFMYHQCRAKDWTAGTNTAVMGKTLNKKTLGQAYVHLPALEVQKMIAARLDFIDEQIRASKSSADKLEHLVKSRFVEMFGSSSADSRYEVCRIGDIADVFVGVVVKPKQYYTDDHANGIKAFRSLNVGEMQVRDDDWVYFSKEGNKKAKKTQLHAGDVLVVRSGYPGTSCVVPLLYEGCNAVDLIIARSNSNNVLPEYIAAFNNGSHMKSLINQMSVGSAQKHFNIGFYRNVEIPLPPLSAQKEYVSFLRQVNKSRFIAQQQIEKLQMLYDSLAQDYFGD